MMQPKPVTAINARTMPSTKPKQFPSMREAARSLMPKVSDETLRKRIALVCESGGGVITYGRSSWYFKFTK